jgi:hypothetical protein
MPHIQIYRLQSKRRALEAEIRRELRRNTPDARRVLALRELKDALRQQLMSLQPA